MGAPRFPLLFVVGVGRSGSTLLGSRLHEHPRGACVGEMARIGQARASGRPCSCGATIDACPLWKDLLPLIGDGRGGNPFALTPADYAAVRMAIGADVLVDTSKSIVVRMFGRWLGPWRKADAGFLFLVRDSRGVLASALRNGKALGPQLEKHENWMKRLVRFVDRQGERALTLHYEDLCAAPGRELGRVCAWAGLEPDPALLRPPHREHHLVHANPMNYLGRTGEIRLDERWRQELDAGSRAGIEGVMERIPLLYERYLRAPSPASG